MEKRTNRTLERRRFEGVANIIRFNRIYFLLATVAICVLTFMAFYLSGNPAIIAGFAAILSILLAGTSLVASFYVYDYSDLYELNWLPDFNRRSVLNINAGFDEASQRILQRFPTCKLIVCDFFDADSHTESSIKIARESQTEREIYVSVETVCLPFPNSCFDFVVIFLAAHEIRREMERVKFFEEISRVLNPDGAIFVTEHLRDGWNLVAYSIGSFHFYSRRNWLRVFRMARLNASRMEQITPFVTTFTLKKNGNSD